VTFSVGDNPGGRFPVVHPNDATRLIRKITIDQTFATWLAVRPSSAPHDKVSSYIFLRHCEWHIVRDIRISHQPSGLGFNFVKNEVTFSRSVSKGRGPRIPVLTGSTANVAVNVTFG